MPPSASTVVFTMVRAGAAVLQDILRAGRLVPEQLSRPSLRPGLQSRTASPVPRLPVGSTQSTSAHPQGHPAELPCDLLSGSTTSLSEDGTCRPSEPSMPGWVGGGGPDRVTTSRYLRGRRGAPLPHSFAWATRPGSGSRRTDARVGVERDHVGVNVESTEVVDETLRFGLGSRGSRGRPVRSSVSGAVTRVHC